jgi:heat shock protein HspQ
LDRLTNELSKANERLVSFYAVLIKNKEKGFSVNLAEQNIAKTEKEKEILNGLIYYVENYGDNTG